MLGLLVATSEAEFGEHDGQYQFDNLERFIERVRVLIRNSSAKRWNAVARAEVLTILGDALTTYSEQSRKR